ncbi:FtsQ-type POTRA domain-containing protein [Candidatus Roizmanbacteria bacterium]|nr:FtsQ-type POTRA domain-containing protein [Candidatus Roizmanbacteria bacterium]
MQQLSSSRKLWGIAKNSVALLCISIITFGLMYVANGILQIRNITVLGYTDSVPIRGISSYAQKNLLLISSKNIEKTLLEENPHIRLVSVKKMFPNSLVITVEGQPFIAAFEMNDGYVYLSEKGKIIEKSKLKREGIPLIRYYQKMNYTSYNANDSIEYADILTALHFLKTMSDLALQTDTVDINGLDMLLFTVGEKKLFFTTEKSKEIQDYELKQIIKQFKIERKEFTSLDLRFEKPIVRF